MRGGQWVALLVVLVLSGLFAAFNAAERTTLNLGFTVIYRVSLVRLVLGSFLLGMLTMFLIGLRQDLRLRRELRRHGLLDSRGVLRPPAGSESQRRPWEARVSETAPPRTD